MKKEKMTGCLIYSLAAIVVIAAVAVTLIGG